MDEAIEWLRQQVQARLDAARKAGTGEPWEADRHYDALYFVDMKPSDGPVTSAVDLHEASLGMPEMHDFENPRFLWASTFQARHIALNDPQDVIARCEAELGILHVYGLWAAEDEPGHPAMGAAACAVSDAVRHLASGYKHRDGYAEHWGEA